MSRIRLLVTLGLLLLSLVTSGLVLQAMSFALPAVSLSWHVEGPQLSLAFSAHLLGIVIGALALGRLGDRFGRKTLLLSGLLLQGVASIASALAADPGWLTLTRLIAGIGVGGCTPNAVSLALESSPARWRTRATSLVLSGVALGSCLPALVVRWLLPTQGWPVLFWSGGAASLLTAAVIWIVLHESFVPSTGRAGTSESGSGSSGGLRQLVRGALLRPTLLLWTLYAACMMSLHLVTSWLPLLLGQAGLSFTQAADLTGLIHLSGAVATLCTTALLERLGQLWLLLLLVTALISTAVLAAMGLGVTGLSVWIAGLGFGLIGSQGVLGSLAAQLYPAHCRPSGIGAALAAGRAGSMAGPLLGGAAQMLGIADTGVMGLAVGALCVAIGAAWLFTRSTLPSC